MDRNVDIYCEVEFLKQFIAKCPKTTSTIPHNDYKYWQYYLNLFCGKSDIVLIDFGDEELRDLNDDSPLGQILNFILQSHADGVGNLVCIPNEGKNLSIYEQDNEGEEYFINHNQTLFFLNRSEHTCNKMEDDYGLMFISPDSIFKRAKLLFEPKREIINSKTKNHWSSLKTYRHPCHSIYLIDNYILGKNIKTLEDNIKSLFDALLPSNLNKRKFIITIKTEIPEQHNESWAIKVGEKVKRWIKELRNNYSIDISIDFTINENHDRDLFTNYFLIDSGYGFILTKGQRRKGTKATIFPITHPSSLEIMRDLQS